MAQFLYGLNQKIHDIVELQHCINLKDKVHTAILVKRQLKSRRTSTKMNSNYGTTWKLNWEKKDEVASLFVPTLHLENLNWEGLKRYIGLSD